jgi:hypothetical protein
MMTMDDVSLGEPLEVPGNAEGTREKLNTNKNLYRYLDVGPINNW